MKTIRQQLTRQLLLAGALAIALGSLAVYLCTRAALEAQFDAGLRAKAHALTSLTEEDAGGVAIDASDEQLRNFEEGGRDLFELRLAGEKVVARSRSLRDRHLPSPHGSLENPAFWSLTLPDGQAGRAVGVRFRPKLDDLPAGTEASDVTLVVASNSSELDRTLATLLLVLAGGGAFLLAATALIGPRLLRRALAPLQKLADQAARIDATSLSTRFPTTGQPGELAPISARLNELLARLEVSFDRERRFSSDVAHEFRTPLAELRSAAELAIKLPDTRTARNDQEVLAIAQHLEDILARLLALARGERGELLLQRERVELASLLRAVCDQFRSRAAARQLAFECLLPPAGEVDTDPILLRSILLNLLDNAVEYTPPGGSVSVEVRSDGGCITVCVANTVANLAEDDLPRLFDRFWRKDAARTADGHTGLGLSIAQTFAGALGCELTASFGRPARLALTLTGLEAAAVTRASRRASSV